MANGLSFSQIADIAIRTGPDYYKQGLYNIIATKYQEYVATKMLMENAAPGGGSSITWPLAINLSANVGTMQPFQTVAIAETNYFTQATVNYRGIWCGWAVDTALVNQNQWTGAEQIVNYINSQRDIAMTSFAQQIENIVWIPRSTDDGKTPFGIWYYIVPNVTGTDANGNTSDGTSVVGAFTGTTTFGGTTNPAGVSNNNWANYCNKYTAMGYSDLGQKLLNAMILTNFQNPIPYATSNPSPPKRSIYVGIALLDALYAIGRSQNDSMGFDLSRGLYDMSCMGVPIKHVPALNANTDNPVLGVNWNALAARYLNGFWNNEVTHQPTATQPTVVSTTNISYFNMICTDRRSQFCLSTAASYAG